MLDMVSGQYTRVLLFGGVWCWIWSQTNKLVFCCLVESSVGYGLRPIHSCFVVWWSLVLDMVSGQYTRVLLFGGV